MAISETLEENLRDDIKGMTASFLVPSIERPIEMARAMFHERYPSQFKESFYLAVVGVLYQQILTEAEKTENPAIIEGALELIGVAMEKLER